MMMSAGVLLSRKGERIVTRFSDELEALVSRRVSKYSSDLRTLVVYLTQGHGGVGGVLVYRDLQERYPEEHKELKEITRKALLLAEESKAYGFVPEGYKLDRSDPDILVLKRDDEEESFVAVFSASGVTVQGILDAVKDHERRRGS